MLKNSHKRRNTTNRNLIVISVGFLATFMAAAFVFQTYTSSWANRKPKHYVLLKIEDSTGLLLGKQFDMYLLDSIVYTDTLHHKNQEYLHTLDCIEKEQIITVLFPSIEATASEKISVADTGTTFLMLKVLKSDTANCQLLLRKFSF